MAIKYKTKGFIFKRDDRNESDRNFSIFTEDFGRVEVLGKAIRKINSKLKSGIDLFYFSEIEFVEGMNKKTLTDAGIIEKFENISKDFKRMQIAFKISEMLENFIKGHRKEEGTFYLIKDAFEKLNQKSTEDKVLQLVYYYFLWNFLSAQGYEPQMSKCASCGDKLNPYGLYFSCKEGGVICQKCLIQDRDAKKINSDIVKIIRIILKKDWHTAERLKVETASMGLLKEVSSIAIQNFCPT